MRAKIAEAKKLGELYSIQCDRGLLEFLYGYFEEAVKLESASKFRSEEWLAEYEANFKAIKEALDDE